MRITLSVLVLVAACASDEEPEASDAMADCTVDSRAEAYAPGMQAMAPDGTRLVLVSAEPGPPVRFDNTWTVQALGADGEPLAVTDLRVEPFMPDHGHGTPEPPEPVAEAEPGRYRMGPFDLWMPGIWQLHFSMDHGETTSTATLSFCIEE